VPEELVKRLNDDRTVIDEQDAFCHDDTSLRMNMRSNQPNRRKALMRLEPNPSLSRLMTTLRHWMAGASVEGCFEINPNRGAYRNHLMVSVNPYSPLSS